MKIRNILKNQGVQAILSSIICILLGLIIGFIVLLFIDSDGAFEAMSMIIKNFFKYNRSELKLQSLANTLVKTAPLIMCSLSILFAYKGGLFNIGAAGQYVAGACAALFGVFGLGWNWFGCLILAALAGALLGIITGVLKVYFNVNEVISGIMLNWIALYTTNIILSKYVAAGRKNTPELILNADYHGSILPGLGLGKLFNEHEYIGLSIVLAICFAFIIRVILNKTRFGFELKATGLNKDAAKYAGMAEKRTMILTLAIGGVLAGLGAAFLFLTDYAQWDCNQTSVPAMGFNGIAAAFLGGLNPIGSIFSSYFIQHITDGGVNVDTSTYCAQISDLISSIIIYLCGFTGFIRHLINTGTIKLKKKDEKGGIE